MSAGSTLLFASLPPAKAIAMIFLFGAVFGLSLSGLFASRKRLIAMSNVTGTKNPTVARTVCGIGVVVGGGAVLVTVLSLIGVLQ